MCGRRLGPRSRQSAARRNTHTTRFEVALQMRHEVASWLGQSARSWARPRPWSAPRRTTASPTRVVRVVRIDARPCGARERPSASEEGETRPPERLGPTPKTNTTTGTHAHTCVNAFTTHNPTLREPPESGAAGDSSVAGRGGTLVVLESPSLPRTGEAAESLLLAGLVPGPGAGGAGADALRLRSPRSSALAVSSSSSSESAVERVGAPPVVATPSSAGTYAVGLGRRRAGAAACAAAPAVPAASASGSGQPSQPRTRCRRKKRERARTTKSGANEAVQVSSTGDGGGGRRRAGGGAGATRISLRVQREGKHETVTVHSLVHRSSSIASACARSRAR